MKKSIYPDRKSSFRNRRLNEGKLSNGVYRAIDANFNRSREGLRVCEEITRFLLNDKNFTLRLKRLRHELEDTMKVTTDFKKKMLLARDTRSDVGGENSLSELKRKDARDIFEANMERSKESARALEEFFKLVDKKRSAAFKKIRFRIYNLEKESVEKLEALAR